MAFPFRFRSALRDAQTDAIRVKAVRNALHSAIDAAQREREGLSSRLADAQVVAASLIGTDLEEKRTRRQAKALDEAESTLLTAGRRIAELNEHIAALRDVEQFLNQRLPPLA